MLSVVLITRDDYCRARLRFGNGRPSYVERLFHREKGCVSDHRVHERVLVDGVVERLEGELHHYTIESRSTTSYRGAASYGNALRSC